MARARNFSAVRGKTAVYIMNYSTIPLKEAAHLTLSRRLSQTICIGLTDTYETFLGLLIFSRDYAVACDRNSIAINYNSAIIDALSLVDQHA
jgi:hypothetical protein